MITDNSLGKDEALTLKQAAEMLRCKSTTTVSRWIQLGWLKAHKPTKSWIILRSSVEKLILEGAPDLRPPTTPKRGRPYKVARISPPKLH
jgi:Helix-turn-helix domain